MNPTNRKALVIGINRYPYLKQDGHLKVPADDAEKMAQLLAEYGYFHPIYRFPEEKQHDGETLRSYVEPKPDLSQCKTEDLKRAIENLFKPPTDIPYTALLFFAGHGLVDDNGELILATSQAGCRNKEWGISSEWLCDVLEASDVQQQIVWLDCCNSGKWIELAEKKLSNSDKQLFFITATTSYESAYAGKQGVLTKIILEGLDPSKDSEGLITHNKLERFIEDNPPQIAQKIIVHSSSTSEIYLTCTDKYKLGVLNQQQNFTSQPNSKKSDNYRNNHTNGSDIINTLYNALLKLDYKKQAGRFEEFVEKNSIGACLIHGNLGCGQRWLLNRLIQHIPNITTSDKIENFSFLTLTRGGSIDDLLYDIVKKLKIKVKLSSKSKSCPVERAKAICEVWKHQNVILIFQDVDQIDETYLEKFLAEFWQPLTNLASSSPSPDYRLLMFLIDYQGDVEKWNIPWINDLENNWQPDKPINLKKIDFLSEPELSYWLTLLRDKRELPNQIIKYIEEKSISATVQDILENSKSGLHERALEYICEICNCDWYDQENKWLKY